MKHVRQDRSVLFACSGQIATIWGIAALMIMVLLPVYYAARQNARELIISEATRSLNAGFQDLNNDLESLFVLLNNLRTQEQVTRLARAHDGVLQNHTLIYHYQNQVRPQSTFAQIDFEVFIQFRANNILLTRSRCFLNKQVSYGRFYGYDAMDYQGWQRQLFQGGNRRYWPAQPVTLYDWGSVPCVTLNAYSAAATAPLVVCSAVIPVQSMMRFLLIPIVEKGGCVYLYNDAGLLAATDALPATATEALALGTPGRMADNAYYLLNLNNSNTQLRAMVGISEAALTEAVRPVAGVLRTYLWIALTIATALSTLYVWVFLRPLHVLARRLQARYQAGQTSRFGLYRQFENIIKAISTTEERLRQNHHDMLLRINAVAFERALQGKALTEEEQRYLAQNHVLLGRYVLVLLDGPQDSSQARCMDSVRYALTQTLVEKHFSPCHIQYSERLHAVLPMAADMETLRLHLSALLETLKQEGIALHMGVSLPHQGIQELCQASMEAQQAVFSASLAGQSSGFALYQSHNAVIHAPFEQYHILSNYILSGNAEKAEEILNDFAEMLLVRSLTLEQTRTVLNNIRAAINNAVDELKGVFAFPFIGEAEDDAPLNRLKHMRACVQEICRTINSAKSERTGEILDHIARHALDPSLSLSAVAEHFQVSQGYVSRLIQKETGMTYLWHVNNLRLTEALRLLTQTERSIEEISGRAGFYSKNTFYKCFKKHFGITPNQARKHIQKYDATCKNIGKIHP